jgi:hypothetical protein
MKVKIFAKEYERRKLDAVSTLEAEINAWLGQHPGVKIVDIKQSSNGGSWNDTQFFLSVWYEENG